MKVYVAGKGGREHAQAHAAARAGAEVMVGPGNEGMEALAAAQDFSMWTDPAAEMDRLETIVVSAKRFGADVVEIGSDDLLAAGLRDALDEAGIPAVGPTRRQAQLEWSKGWASEHLQDHGIPYPATESFRRSRMDELEPCLDRLDAEGRFPVWVKFDPLLAGKGALKATDREAVLRILEEAPRHFGDKAEHFSLQEHAPGDEVSVYGITDGESILPLPPARDHKRLYNRQRGPQTGGMGGYTLDLPDRESRFIEDHLIRDTVLSMRREGRGFEGVLYGGAVLLPGGRAVAIEYNVRQGDPEAQMIMPGMRNWPEVLAATAGRELGEVTIDHDGRFRICLVMSMRGYARAGRPLDEVSFEGLGDVLSLPAARRGDLALYSAAMKFRRGRLAIAGAPGRALNVVVAGDRPATAVREAHEAARILHEANAPWLHHRTDIGRDVAEDRDRPHIG